MSSVVYLPLKGVYLILFVFCTSNDRHGSKLIIWQIFSMTLHVLNE